jgi:hypothetical protein
VTIALVGLSWACGYMRVGVLVLFVHDFSDIFVDLLKMVNYLKLENRRGLFASEIAYIVCVLSWVYFRLYEFPFRVVRGSLTVPYTLLLRTPRESYSFLGLECVRRSGRLRRPSLPGAPASQQRPDRPHLSLPPPSPARAPARPPARRRFFPSDLPWHFHLNVMLFALLLLHIYWFHLFLMIGYRILTESAREASRQEYEGDSDEEEDKKEREGGGEAAGAALALPPAAAAAGEGARRGRGGGGTAAAASAAARAATAPANLADGSGDAAGTRREAAAAKPRRRS